jgi:hypothetical protein
MVLDYPNHLNRKSGTIKGSGMPLSQGTKVLGK